MYDQQNGREFHTNEQEMGAFLGIKYTMSIDKLLAIKIYWEFRQFIGNEGIRNVIARFRFEDILRNLHFLGNTEDYKSDRSLINHFNQSFSNSVSNGHSQSIDEYMVKLKGRSSMKQYVKTSQSNGVSSFGIVALVKQDTSINLT